MKSPSFARRASFHVMVAAGLVVIAAASGADTETPLRPLGLDRNAAALPVDSIGAYAWPMSVAPGDTVNIYVSARGSTYDMQFMRQGVTNVQVAYVAKLHASIQPVPDSAWANGCNWSPSYSFRVPDSWTSGVYGAWCITTDTTFVAMFVVREKQPGSASQILFEMPVTTWQAYNRWGGHSLYNYNSDGNAKGWCMSFKRPNSLHEGRGFYTVRETNLVAFLEMHGFDVAYCMGTDLQWLPDLESHYDLVIGCGHDEYWSREMRDAMEARTARGGNTAFFAGNLCWWQVRLQPDGRMVCYKDKTADPLTGVDDSRVTVRWFDDPVYRPENSMTGVSFRNGGGPVGDGGYFAYHTDHWIYAGTGLTDSTEFGASGPIVAYETDGALFDWSNGEPVVTGSDGTPSTFVILGEAPTALGHATMGMFSGPGLVFNAATTDWVMGLPTDTLVQHITYNVVNGLRPHTITAADRRAEPAAAFSVSVTPNPGHSSVTIEWRAPATGAGSRMWIADVGGRVVARPEIESAPSGRFRWNGKDRSGHRVAPGVYFATVQSGPSVSVRRFLLLE